MAGFSSGFNQGLDLMLSARRLNLYEEQMETQRKEAERKDVPVSDVGIEGFAEGTTIGEAEQVSTIQSRVAATEGQAARTELLKKQTELIDIDLSPEMQELATNERELILREKEINTKVKEMGYEEADRYTSAKLSEYVYGSLKTYAQDENIPSKVGTASFDVMINHLAGIVYDDVKKGNLDIVRVLSKPMAEAVATINPLIKQIRQNPEILENLNLGDYNESLNEIFGMKSRGFIGKRYIANDGTKGTIKSVELDFNSFEVDEKTINTKPAAVLKGNFTYVDDEGNEYTKTSFIPDIKKSAIRETQAGTDAQSVSLADMIDLTSSVSLIISDAVSKPENAGMFEVAEALEKKLKSMLERTTEGEMALRAQASDEFRKNEKNLYEKIRVNQTLQNAINKIGGNNEKESESIRTVLESGIDISSDIDILSSEEVDDLGWDKSVKHYRMKRNTAGVLLTVPNEAIINTLPTEAEILKNLKSGTVYEKQTAPTIRQPQTFQFRSATVEPGETRQTYLPKIKEQFQEQDIDALVKTIELRYQSRYPNNPELQDNQLLDLLFRTLVR